jgi:4-hydroxy-tetrahydrodipicolinate reductase
MKTHIAVNGACGRMGQRIVQLAREDKDLALAAALDMPGHPQQGRDIGEIAGMGAIGVFVSNILPAEQRIDVLIDFSLPEGTMSVLPICVERKIPIVVATTGHSPAQKRDIEAAAHHTPLLMAPNMSLAVNVLMYLCKQAGTLLRDRNFDVEILERHHRFKKDSPSGTALHLAKILQEAMGQTELRHGREGLVGERPLQEIGVHAVRVGDNVGEHTIVFSTLGETLEITHRAHARDCYVRGALLAAKFLATRPPGRYGMNDVLGLPG